MAYVYKTDARDFISRVAGLSLEDIGAYTLLLNETHLMGRSPRNDDKHLAGNCWSDIRKWRNIKKRLLDRGLLVEAADGRIEVHGGNNGR